jgi:hypothetical protein
MTIKVKVGDTVTWQRRTNAVAVIGCKVLEILNTEVGHAARIDASILNPDCSSIWVPMHISTRKPIK